MVAIRVLIADDHSLLREGLRGIIASQDDITVVGESTNGSDAAEDAARLMPDVVLLDLGLPGPGGAETARRIRQACPATAILAMMLEYDRTHLMDAIRAGAGGYVLKDVDGRTLVRAIRGVHRTPRPQQWEDKARLLTEMEDVLRAESDHLVFGGQDRAVGCDDGDGFMGPPAGSGCPLTAREREVLAVMATGVSNAEIGRTLFISEKTVKNHATSIFRKVGVQGRKDAVRKAARRGWLDLS